jgi:hypothetical protein
MDKEKEQVLKLAKDMMSNSSGSGLQTYWVF